MSSISGSEYLPGTDLPSSPPRLPESRAKYGLREHEAHLPQPPEEVKQKSSYPPTPSQAHQHLAHYGQSILDDIRNAFEKRPWKDMEGKDMAELLGPFASSRFSRMIKV